MGPFDAIASPWFAWRSSSHSISEPSVRIATGRVTGSRGPGHIRGVDELRTRLAEVEERLDFAERLLAKADATDQLPGRVERDYPRGHPVWLDRLEAGALKINESSPISDRDDARRRRVVVHYAPPVSHPAGQGDGASREGAATERALPAAARIHARDPGARFVRSRGEPRRADHTLELEKSRFQ